MGEICSWWVVVGSLLIHCCLTDSEFCFFNKKLQMWKCSSPVKKLQNLKLPMKSFWFSHITVLYFCCVSTTPPLFWKCSMAHGLLRNKHGYIWHYSKPHFVGMTMKPWLFMSLMAFSHIFANKPTRFCVLLEYHKIH